MTAGPTLALIGSGPIASAHLAAARRAGFRVTAVAGRRDSARAAAFAVEHDIPDLWSDPADLAASGTWDSLILAVAPSATLDLLLPAAAHGKPVLVEKPVALSSVSLAPYRTSWPHVVVGYNRRHYASVRSAKAFIERHGPSLLHMELPEAVAPHGSAVEEREAGVRSNSVHGLDLLRYLVGDLSVESVASLGEPAEYAGRFVTLRSARGDLCTVTANWNSPTNFGIDIHAGPERFQLRPLEIGYAFRGMDVIEPTPEVPIRQYVPICVETVPPDELSRQFKPGFARQAMALRNLVDGLEPGPEAATMHDAYEAMVLAEVVLRGVKE